MYTILKSKRFHIQLPPSQKSNNFSISYKNNINESQFYSQNSLKYQQKTQQNNLDQAIISSCFIDNVFVLFLFNTGRYMIVNTLSTQEQTKIYKNYKNYVKNQQSILYDGNLLNEIKNNHQNQQEIIKNYYYENQQQQSTKIIFTECKRVQPGECVIITKNSTHAYLLKVQRSRTINQNETINTNTNNHTKNNILTKITKLPQTMLNILITEQNNAINMQNMTILTQIFQFNNSTNNFTQNLNKNLNKNSPDNNYSKQSFQSVGNFAIKNQIVQDKMVYFTVYIKKNRIIQNQSYKNKLMQETQNYLHKNINKNQSQQYTVINFQYALPINQQHSNFIIQVCDKYTNQIAIYKQTQSDDMQWQIKIYRFDQKYSKLSQNDQKYQQKSFILANQFNSSYYLQQFTRWNQQNSYILVCFIQNENINIENKISFYNCKFITVNNNNNKPEYHQSIQKMQNFDINKHINFSSFLKIIHINQISKVCYILSLAHERIQGQLYENKIDIVNMNNSQIIQRGYCSLKNYSFSNNFRQILDVPYSYEQKDEMFFHVRSLFSKKILYLYLIENSNHYFKQYQNVQFVQRVLSML